jgi:hypothetical protein
MRRTSSDYIGFIGALRGSVMKILCIYNASSTWVGELSYLFGKIFQNSSCSMCDLSHSLTGIKKEWQEMEADSDHEYRLLHSNDLPTDIPPSLIKYLPCVIRETEDESERFSLLISRDQLSGCNGSITAFSALLESTLKVS